MTIPWIVIGWIAATALSHPASSERSEQRAQGLSLWQAGQYAEARPALEAHLTAHPDDHEAMWYLGKILFAADQYDPAVAWLERAVALRRTSEYLHWLGRAYGMKAKHAFFLSQPGLAGQAKRAFDQAVQLDGDNLSARMDLLQFHLRAPGVVGGSVEQARLQAQAIGRRNGPLGLLAGAMVNDQAGDTRLAELSLRALLNVAPPPEGPFLAQAHLLLGKIQLKRGEKSAAKWSFQTAQRLNPLLKEVKEALKQTEE